MVYTEQFNLDRVAFTIPDLYGNTGTWYNINTRKSLAIRIQYPIRWIDVKVNDYGNLYREKRTFWTHDQRKWFASQLIKHQPFFGGKYDMA